MAAIVVLAIFAAFLALTFVAWRRYLWAAEKLPRPALGKLPFQLPAVRRQLPVYIGS